MSYDSIADQSTLTQVMGDSKKQLPEPMLIKIYAATWRH